MPPCEFDVGLGIRGKSLILTPQGVPTNALSISLVVMFRCFDCLLFPGADTKTNGSPYASGRTDSCARAYGNANVDAHTQANGEANRDSGADIHLRSNTSTNAETNLHANSRTHEYAYAHPNPDSNANGNA